MAAKHYFQATMDLKKTLPLILASIFINNAAYAGAISAGGMTMPPTIECLFKDPQNKFKPYNLMVTDVGNPQLSGSLTKVDLPSRKEVSSRYFDVSTKMDQVTQTFFIQSEIENLRVEVRIAQRLRFNEFPESIKVFEDLDKVDFVRDAIGHPSNMVFAEQVYEGICSNGPLFYYHLDR